MATPTILAHVADAPLPAMLERSLARSLPQAGGSAGDRVTILLATKRLAYSADEALIGQALEAWSEGRLLVVSVDGATPPLGLRDVERLDWTPGKDDAQLARIGDGVARLAASLARPASGEEGPAVAPVPTTARAAAPRKSRAAIAVTAGLAAVLGLASVFFAAQFTRERAPSQGSAPPVMSPAPLPSPAPTGSPPLPEAAPRQEPAPAQPAPAQPVTARPASPDLSRPSGGGPAPPAGAPASGPEPGAGLPEVVVTALLLVPALLALFVIFRLTRRRPKPVGAEAAASTTAPPSAPAAAPASSPPALDGAKRIFVSYSHQDIDRVDPIIAEIERLGHPVWIDRRELSGGPGWAGQIVRGLRAARTVVLMASRHAYASDQVVREMYLAMSEKKPIVPLELETAEIPDELQYILAPFQRHRLEGGDRSSIVRNALAAL